MTSIPISATSQSTHGPGLRVAVIGSGISGLAAAWALKGRHRVVLFEAESRFGGHSNTVEVEGPWGQVAVDTGFIVYNETNYPNLAALFQHLGVETNPAPMTFSVSLDGGRLEYGSRSLDALFGQRRNLLDPGFWRLAREIKRFYGDAARHERDAAPEITLGAFMRGAGYSRRLFEEHIVPMCAAIWSAPPSRVGEMPLTAYLRFFMSHGLFDVAGGRQWRTVSGGSRVYVEKMLRGLTTRRGAAVRRVLRDAQGIEVEIQSGHRERFDRVAIATHADQALALLDDPTDNERHLLGAFKYSKNHAVLHGDANVMPRRRRVWASWNYAGGADRNAPLQVTYWMNALQSLDPRLPLFLTLNPAKAPAQAHASFAYTHPQFDAAALLAQRRLWQLQGRRNTWFCGAYFGYGFHEDGLQAGLAAAENMGGLRRPWSVPDQSGRIALGPLEVVAAE